MSAHPAIGARCRRFTLQVPVDTPDGFGGVLRTWQPGPLVWGEIRLLSEGERRDGDQAQAVASHRLRLRYREDVGSDARLTLGSREFRIRAASDPDGRRRDLLCLLEEIRP